MLVNSESLLRDALKNGYAIPSYNINNLEWTRFILEACQKDNSPVVLSVTPCSVKYFGGYRVVFNVVKSLITDLKIKIPVVLNLDHGSSFSECKSAIDAGFTSVMIDASRSSIEENIKITNSVIEYAKQKNITVEAEVGWLDDKDSHTKIEDITQFVLKTGVHSIAPAIGNYHGFYKKEPKLDFELLGAIAKEVRIPLVLHGASFLDENKIKTAIFCGVSKININTDLQKAWSDSIRVFLNCDKSVCDPRLIIKSGEDALKKRVHYNNLLFGSINRAF